MEEQSHTQCTELVLNNKIRPAQSTSEQSLIERLQEQLHHEAASARQARAEAAQLSGVVEEYLSVVQSARDPTPLGKWCGECARLRRELEAVKLLALRQASLTHEAGKTAELAVAETQQLRSASQKAQEEASRVSAVGEEIMAVAEQMKHDCIEGASVAETAEAEAGRFRDELCRVMQQMAEMRASVIQGEAAAQEVERLNSELCLAHSRAVEAAESGAAYKQQSQLQIVQLESDKSRLEFQLDEAERQLAEFRIELGDVVTEHASLQVESTSKLAAANNKLDQLMEAEKGAEIKAAELEGALERAIAQAAELEREKADRDSQFADEMAAAVAEGAQLRAELCEAREEALQLMAKAAAEVEAKDKALGEMAAESEELKAEMGAVRVELEGGVLEQERLRGEVERLEALLNQKECALARCRSEALVGAAAEANAVELSKELISTQRELAQVSSVARALNAQVAAKATAASESERLERALRAAEEQMEQLTTLSEAVESSSKGRVNDAEAKAERLTEELSGAHEEVVELKAELAQVRTQQEEELCAVRERLEALLANKEQALQEAAQKQSDGAAEIARLAAGLVVNQAALQCHVKDIQAKDKALGEMAAESEELKAEMGALRVELEGGVLEQERLRGEVERLEALLNQKECALGVLAAEKAAEVESLQRRPYYHARKSVCPQEDGTLAVDQAEQLKLELSEAQARVFELEAKADEACTGCKYASRTVARMQAVFEARLEQADELLDSEQKARAVAVMEACRLRERVAKLEMRDDCDSHPVVFPRHLSFLVAIAWRWFGKQLLRFKKSRAPTKPTRDDNVRATIKPQTRRSKNAGRILAAHPKNSPTSSSNMAQRSANKHANKQLIMTNDTSTHEKPFTVYCDNRHNSIAALDKS